MKKKQFDKLAELLYSRGYKKYGQTWHNEDYVIAKGFHKEDNKWGYARWLDIYILSEQLESEAEKKHWANVCSRYNHIEEYYARCV